MVLSFSLREKTRRTAFNQLVPSDLFIPILSTHPLLQTARVWNQSHSSAFAQNPLKADRWKRPW